MLGSLRPRDRDTHLDEVCCCPAKLLCAFAVAVVVVDKVTVLVALNTRFPHGLGKHVLVRFANDGDRRVVAIRQALEQILDAEQLDNPLGVVDVGIGQEPEPDLARVDILEHLAQLRVGLDDALEGQRIVHLGVVL